MTIHWNFEVILNIEFWHLHDGLIDIKALDSKIVGENDTSAVYYGQHTYF